MRDKETVLDFSAGLVSLTGVTERVCDLVRNGDEPVEVIADGFFRRRDCYVGLGDRTVPSFRAGFMFKHRFRFQEPQKGNEREPRIACVPEGAGLCVVAPEIAVVAQTVGEVSGALFHVVSVGAFSRSKE